MVSAVKFCLTRLYWKGLEKVFCGFYVLRLTQYFFNKTQISSVEAQKTLWGGAFWRKKFQFWRKYTINLLLRHKRGINSYSKMGGQVVMRCTAAALRHLLCCQNLGGQLPTLPTRHWRPGSIRSSDLLTTSFLFFSSLLFRYKGDTISRAARACATAAAATACCLPLSHCDQVINNVQPLIL